MQGLESEIGRTQWNHPRFPLLCIFKPVVVSRYFLEGDTWDRRKSLYCRRGQEGKRVRGAGCRGQGRRPTNDEVLMTNDEVPMKATRRRLSSSKSLGFFAKATGNSRERGAGSVESEIEVQSPAARTASAGNGHEQARSGTSKSSCDCSCLFVVSARSLKRARR